MLRRVLFALNNQRTLVGRSIRSLSTTPQNEPNPKETEPKKENPPKQENREDEDANAYDDYGDVKIRKGGRTIKVDESEQMQESPIKKSFNAASAGFRFVYWGSLAYLTYTLYDYVNNPDKKASNVVDEYFLEGAKYVHGSYRKTIDFFTKPPSDKLLPEIPYEVLPPGFDYPKTLLINLSGTTIHSNFGMGKGREVIKRPGLDELIKHFGGRFELVIFSDDDLMLINSVAVKLDPIQQRISYALGSESMSIEGAHRIKDLKYINRDARKIIVLDHVPDRLRKQPENGIFIPTFEGDVNDTELFKLFPLLEHLSSPNVYDVREELKKYGNFSPGEKFLAEIEKRKTAIAQKRKGGLTGFFGQQQRPQQRA